MQFSKEKNLDTSIRSVESGRILVGEEYISHSLVLNAKEIIGRWMGSNADQTSFDQIKYILKKEPDVIIFGTGDKSVIPQRNLVFDLAKKNIGIEVMTSAAAAKTFNILISEGRNPVAIIIID
jgi:uncharacterized protein